MIKFFLFLAVSMLLCFSGIAQTSNVMRGKFTVSESGKKVQFTKGNLYWDGSAFHFEKKQTDYPTAWNPNHIGHFYWTTTASASYAEKYSAPDAGASNVPFFAQSKGGLTVDGTSGLFALSHDECEYLIKIRPNATNLCNYGVTVGGKKNCLVIAPDGFTRTLKSSYTLSEIETLGLVCLPAAGGRIGSDILYAEGLGIYWSATPDSDNSDYAYYLSFGLDEVFTNSSYHSGGRSYRLVRLAQ